MKKPICVILLFALLLTLCACGRTDRSDPGRTAPTAEPVPAAETGSGDGGASADAPGDASPDAAGTQPADPSAFPIAAAPFSFDESADMLNFNSRGCARLVENMYYTCFLQPEGGRALVRFEMIDGNLLRRTVLLDGSGAEYLTLSEGRLYCLGPDGRPESLRTDGTDRRVEFDEPCRSMQLRPDGLYCLLGDGTLAAVTASGRSTVLQGCSYAYIFDRGIFYISAADGVLHFFDDAQRTDTILFSDAVYSAPLVVDGTLYCVASDMRILALDLQSGELRSCGVFAGTDGVSFTYDASLGWAACAREGGTQLTLPFSAMFDSSPAILHAEGAYRLCRGFDGELRTDELFGADGVSKGFALVLPYGQELPY